MATTADEVWQLLGELIEAQKETERRFRETEQLLKEQAQKAEQGRQEAEQRFEETERLLKEQSRKTDQASRCHFVIAKSNRLINN